MKRRERMVEMGTGMMEVVMMTAGDQMMMLLSCLCMCEGLAAEEGEGSQEPRHSNRENRGVPPLRHIEAYLVGAAEEEAKHTPQSV